MVFHFTSPHLPDEARALRECPVGAVLRQAPHVYDAIRAASYAENGSINPLESPLYLQRALGVIGSERDRLWRLKEEDAKNKRDSRYGMQVRRGNH